MDSQKKKKIRINIYKFVKFIKKIILKKYI